MELVSFRITNFRSIDDSGDVKFERITALLGRNESGKTNLLLGLRSLNPAEGFVALNKIKDFPRHRRLEECTPETNVVSSVWKLSSNDKAALTKILPRASSVTHVTIGRFYEARRHVGFNKLTAIGYDPADVTSKVRKLSSAAKAVAAKLEEAPRRALEQAADAFESQCNGVDDGATWATSTTPALSALRQALAAAHTELSGKDILYKEIENLVKSFVGDENAQNEARQWAIKQLPIFIFLDEYPWLSGHQNIAEYLQRKSAGTSTASDKQFEKLCKVAALSPTELQGLAQQNDAETRNQLANRASAVVTKEIKRLWKDRPLKVRFNLDAAHMDTFVSDPNAIYDVEVNLDERSRGFKWFFSFYITFAADTQGGVAEKAILLLDEPGLYLHAKSQADLLVHFEKDFKNQILYTTHSPFMVPTNNLASIRTVNIEEEKGTTVSNDPVGDARTLFPLQAALGYEIAQSLFIGPNNLVVEGVTDFWILSAVNNHLADVGGKALQANITLTPAGGAQKVSYMVALLSSERLNVLVLMDDEKQSRATKDDLVRTKLIRENNVVFVSEAINPIPKEADVEDILEPATYEALVRESYAKELKGKMLKLNPNIPRIAKRLEAGLAELGIEFHKTRPSRLLLSKMAVDPTKIVTPDVARRFEVLFKIINERMNKHIQREVGPFE